MQNRELGIYPTLLMLAFYAMHMWPDGVSRNLLPYALHYACQIQNKVQLKDGSSPEEVF